MNSDTQIRGGFKVENISTYFLVFILSAFVCMVIYHTYLGWIKEANLDFISGVWFNLAKELQEGHLYRPVYSDTGYGGTLYAPLLFVLHSIPIALGLGIKYSGLALVTTINILVMAAIYKILRGNDVGVKASLILALCALASMTYQFSMTSMRPDALATALVLWSAYFCLYSKSGTLSAIIAAFLLILAFTAKITTVYGFFVLVVLLALQKKTKKIILFSGIYWVGTISFLLFVKNAGHAAVLSSAAQSIEDKINLFSLIASPMRLIYVMNTYDTGCLLFFALALAVVFIKFRKNILSFPGILFFATAAVICIILSKPGTDSNHLTDLHAASLILIGCNLNTTSNKTHAYKMAAVVLLIIAIQPIWFQIRNLRSYPDQYLTHLAHDLSERYGENILSENPYLSIAIGQTPYVADPWMCRVIRQRCESCFDPLLEKIKDKSFDAIALVSDPRREEGINFLQNYHFGKGFVENLNRSYKFLEQVQDQIIYVPR